MMGAITLPGLPIETLPNIGPPTVQVTTTFPGADALTVEKTVTAPLEEQINGAPGMDYIMSNSDNEGNIVINVFFKAGVDIVGAQTNVLNRVQTALAELPESVNKQGVTVEATSNTFQLVYTVSSPSGKYDTNYINGLINDNLIYPLSRSSGVAQATLLGAAPPAFRLWINPYKMFRYNLTIEKVIASIKTNNNILVGGTLGALPAKEPKQTSYPIIIDGNIETVDKFNQIPITKTPNGSTAKSTPSSSPASKKRASNPRKKPINAPSPSVSISI
jgi:HAE1 family hydrophobic/amphiphilic exporter-1